MPRSTSLETWVALSLALPLGLAACSFGGSEGGDGDGQACELTFKQLCGLKYEDKRNFDQGLLRIDTSRDTACSELIPADPVAGSPELCVVSAKDIVLRETSVLRAVGPRPLVLAASNTLRIGGLIDVSSHRATDTAAEELGAGAAADPSPCTPFALPPISIATGGGGGAGGSFRGSGGDGGMGSTATVAVAGGKTNPALASAAITGVRAGCHGQTGGDAAGDLNGAAPGIGGAGGGAVYLVSLKDLQILATGKIAANGAGGGGGGSQAGGGGGGSGGLIVIEAKGQVIHAGLLTANGGGGGGGGYYRTAGAEKVSGAPGSDGPIARSSAMGGMGQPAVNGGNGASGAATSHDEAADGTDSSYGGGAGGGGVGWIHVIAQTKDLTRGQSSPPSE
jgi:hypothetical protein